MNLTIASPTLIKIVIVAILFSLVIRYLPKFLRLLKVEGKVLENSLSLVFAALIVYFLIYFVVLPFTAM